MKKGDTDLLAEVVAGQPLSARHMNLIRKILRRTITGPNVVHTIAGVHIRKQQMIETLDMFYAQIGAAVADGTNRWKYAWTEIEKLTAGYGAWTNVLEGRSGSAARNFVEGMNAGTGVQGNGVDIDGVDFPAGFSLQKCPSGVFVVMHRIQVADDEEFWFSYENAIDGTCT